jgi:integrase
MGVDDSREGARCSKVNFHSFRRWFITKLEEAVVPEHVVAKIAGHARGATESFRTYSHARLDTAMKEAVNRVILP